MRPDDHRSRQNTAWFRTRLLGTRAALAASAVVAALTITGVAATNIGHFEPVGQVLGIGGGPSPSATDQVEEALATAGGLIEEGRYADARQALNLARKRAGRLNGPHQDSLAGKIHRLEAQLARESSGQQTATGAPRDQRNASPEPSTEPCDSVTNVQVPDLPDAAGNGADNVTGGEPGTAGGGSDGGESGGADGDGTGVPPDTPTTEASEDGPEPVGSGDSAGQQPMIGDIAGSSAPSAADDGKLNGKGKAQGKEGKAQGKGRGRRP